MSKLRKVRSSISKEAVNKVCKTAKCKSSKGKTRQENNLRPQPTQTPNSLVKDFLNKPNNKFKVSKAVSSKRVTVGKILYWGTQNIKISTVVRIEIRFLQVGLAIQTRKFPLTKQLVSELA